jgi:hypothetical protein
MKNMPLFRNETNEIVPTLSDSIQKSPKRLVYNEKRKNEKQTNKQTNRFLTWLETELSPSFGTTNEQREKKKKKRSCCAPSR